MRNRIYFLGFIVSILLGGHILFADSFENNRIEVYISTKENLTQKKYVLEEEIVRFIDEAQKSLDIAVQELRSGKINTTSNPIKESILRAAGRGVQVRIIVEASYLKPNSDNLNTFAEFLNTENISISADQNPYIFHNKFIVRDKDTDTAALLTGSTNFTDTGTRRNYNHILVLHFKGDRKPYFEILDRYQEEFDELLSGTFGNKEPTQEIKTYQIGNTRLTVLFSPDNDPDDFLLKTILKADETLDVMMFTFGSNSPLLSGVINRFNAVKYVGHTPTNEPKVKVRIAMEKEQCKYWSAHPTLKKLGIPVKVENTSAKLHHKVGIIDNKRIILGSYNWTLSANEENDENVIVVNNSDMANLFTQAFDELWNNVLVDQD